MLICTKIKMKNYVILVNEQDESLGIEEKLKAHQHGHLHRAFSVMLYRKTIKNNQLTIEFLFQKRSESKYHSAGKWSNTCCSHASPHETIEQSVKRRLQEEIGIQKINVHFLEKILYNLNLEDGFIEHELDYIFIGEIQDEKEISLNPEEVCDFKWITLNKWKCEFQNYPDLFTMWLPYVIDIIEKKINHILEA